MKKLEDYPEILETQEIMELFGLSKSAAYRLIRSKGFPAFKLLGKYTIQKKSLVKWIDRQEQMYVEGR